MTIQPYVPLSEFTASYPGLDHSSRSFSLGQKPGVSIRQLKTQLSVNGQLNTIENAMSADVTNLVTIQWRNGALCSPVDALYLFIQSTLALSTEQMLILMNAASNQPW